MLGAPPEMLAQSSCANATAGAHAAIAAANATRHARLHEPFDIRSSCCGTHPLAGDQEQEPCRPSNDGATDRALWIPRHVVADPSWGRGGLACARYRERSAMDAGES